MALVPGGIVVHGIVLALIGGGFGGGAIITGGITYKANKTIKKMKKDIKEKEQLKETIDNNTKYE